MSSEPYGDGPNQQGGGIFELLDRTRPPGGYDFGGGDATPSWEQHDDDPAFGDYVDKWRAEQATTAAAKETGDKAALEAKLKVAFSGQIGQSAGGSVDASGGGVQKAADLAETGANVVLPYAGPLLAETKVIPGMGEIINAAQGTYHAGAAVYDAVTGDRDGAVAQGAQAAGNLLGVIPGVGETLGAVDMLMGAAGGGLKIAGGESMKDVPQSTGDLLAGLAVEKTNEVFGKDDSNWIAKGDTPQGNRRGEIGAGVGGMLDFLSMGAGGIVRQLEPDFNEKAGNAIGDVFNTPKDAPTTGAGEPSYWQKSGQKSHDLWTGIFD